MLDKTTKDTLDSLLSDWHIWSAGFDLNPCKAACAMFKDAKIPKHWDTTADIDDSIIYQSTMKSIDFAIYGDAKSQGGLNEPYRTAVQFYARNLSAKVSVWSSPRLPADKMDRVKVTNDALDMLSEKLEKAGVL